MTDLELMQQALDALEDYEPNETHNAIKAIRARLAQPEREWQGLTDEQFCGLTAEMRGFAEYIEAKLKEKNNG